MAGRKFGLMSVIARAPENDRHGNVRWECQCECGRPIVVLGSSLRTGNTTSCGLCLRAERTRTHGLSETRVYKTWTAMKDRCSNPKNKAYANYGGRGIAVCDRWMNSFESFYADVGDRPSDQHSIDRINNDGNYEPSNCRWATKSQQQSNQRPRKRKIQQLEIEA